MDVSLNTDVDNSVLFQFIRDDRSLVELCELLAAEKYFCLDTEFVRTKTFYPQAGLFQINVAEKKFLIDPLLIIEWQPFKEILIDESIMKVIHSCSEDIQVFIAFLQLIPKPVFDTQIAEAFLNKGFGVSYRALVESYHGIDLPKEETRSDWLKRPLTDNQLSYAVKDVHYLYSIYEFQKIELEKEGKAEWMKAECEQLLEQFTNDMDKNFDDYYLQFSKAWQFKSKQLAALQKLTSWREQYARQKDKPRNWIIKDAQIVELSTSLPSSLDELKDLSELSDNFIKYEGPLIIDLINQVQEMQESEYPESLPKPVTVEERAKLKKAKAIIENKALEFKLPQEILCRKKLLVALLLKFRDYKKLSDLDNKVDEEIKHLLGWRSTILFDDFKQVLS